MKIDFENFLDFPKGSKVLFNWGAYYPTAEGTIVGSLVKPGSKFFPSEIVLLAEADVTDFEGYENIKFNANGKQIATFEVSQFSEKGIGVSLLETAETKSNANSPWAERNSN